MSTFQSSAYDSIITFVIEDSHALNWNKSPIWNNMEEHSVPIKGFICTTTTIKVYGNNYR